MIDTSTSWGNIQPTRENRLVNKIWEIAHTNNDILTLKTDTRGFRRTSNEKRFNHWTPKGKNTQWPW